MARFIGYVEGNRGEASRLGTPASGIRAQAQGWNSGVKVYGDVDENDQDYFLVYATHGSNGNGSTRLLGRIYTGTDGELYFEGAGELTHLQLAV